MIVHKSMPTKLGGFLAVSASPLLAQQKVTVVAYVKLTAAAGDFASAEEGAESISRRLGDDS